MPFQLGNRVFLAGWVVCALLDGRAAVAAIRDCLAKELQSKWAEVALPQGLKIASGNSIRYEYGNLRFEGEYLSSVELVLAHDESIENIAAVLANDPGRYVSILKSMREARYEAQGRGLVETRIRFATLLPEAPRRQTLRRDPCGWGNCFNAALLWHLPETEVGATDLSDFQSVLAKEFDELPDGAPLKVGDIITLQRGPEESRRPFHAMVYIDDQLIWHKATLGRGPWVFESLQSSVKNYDSSFPRITYRFHRRKSLIDWDSRVRRTHLRLGKDPEPDELTRTGLTQNLRRLIRVIEGDRAQRPDFKVIISGRPRMGKTSLLLQLQDWLRTQGFTPIYVTFQPGMKTEEIQKVFGERLVEAARKEWVDFTTPSQGSGVLKSLAERPGAKPVIIVDETHFLMGPSDSEGYAVGTGLIRDLAAQADLPVIFSFRDSKVVPGYYHRVLTSLREELETKKLANSIDLVMPSFQDLRGYMTRITHGTPVKIEDSAVRAIMLAAESPSQINEIIRALPQSQSRIDWETVAQATWAIGNKARGVRPIPLRPGGPRPINWEKFKLPTKVTAQDGNSEGPIKYSLQGLKGELSSRLRWVDPNYEGKPKVQDSAIKRMYELTDGDPVEINRLIGQLPPDRDRITKRDVDAAFTRVQQLLPASQAK